MTNQDPAARIVEFLIRENGLAETVAREADVAVVLRAVRDELALAWLEGEIYDLSDAELWLNKRITVLTGVKTLTGDTTEERAS